MDVDHDAIRKRKPPGPPPGPPPQLSDSEDEEYDPEKGITVKKKMLRCLFLGIFREIYYFICKLNFFFILVY